MAEYAALMEALQYAVSSKALKLHVYSDSEVVVRQMTGEYECRSPRLYSLHWTCRKLARSLTFSISHVPRANNSEANGLAQSGVAAAAEELIPGIEAFIQLSFVAVIPFFSFSESPLSKASLASFAFWP